MTLTAPPGAYRLVAPPPPPPQRGFLRAGLAVAGIALTSVFAIAAMMVAAVVPQRAAERCDPALAAAASAPDRRLHGRADWPTPAPSSRPVAP